LEQKYKIVHRNLLNGYLEKIDHTAEATYNHIKRSEIMPCLENTRVGVLTRIKTWVERREDNQSRIFWLSGMAGLGKSAISRSIEEWAKKNEMLGANFFFSRDVPHLRDPTTILPTLAYQLALFDDEFKSELADVLAEYPHIPTSDLDTQFEQYIQRPWAASKSLRSKTVLVVLDAIDECDSASASNVKKLLRILLDPGSMPGNFLVLLSSRPEAYIRSAFDERQEHAGIVLEDYGCRSDIEVFLRHHLFNPPKDMMIENSWPEEEDVKKLAEVRLGLTDNATRSMRDVIKWMEENGLEEI